MDSENKYGTLDRQKELLTMMKIVDSFCKNHSISYSLGGGSLLGAIRHNGFIPWDDDIDVMMDRLNFEKFISSCVAFANETPFVINRYLWVYRIQEKKNTTHDLLEPTIDVFAVDNCPDSRLMCRYKTFVVKMLQGMMKVQPDYSGKGLLMKICLFVTHCLGKLFSDEKMFRMYDRVSQIGNDQTTTYVTVYDSLFKYLNKRYKSGMMDMLEYHQFEDTEFQIITDYDSYLKELYGDYMTPPNKKDRLSEHMN